MESPADLIVSPYDTEARFSGKRGMGWIGYKVHFTETCEEDGPHLITSSAEDASLQFAALETAVVALPLPVLSSYLS